MKHEHELKQIREKSSSAGSHYYAAQRLFVCNKLGYLQSTAFWANTVSLLSE